MRHSRSWVLAGCMVCLPAMAAMSASDADRLGRDLTPTGAERAGSSDGLIPAWTGRDAFTSRQLAVTFVEMRPPRRSTLVPFTALLAEIVVSILILLPRHPGQSVTACGMADRRSQSPAAAAPRLPDAGLRLGPQRVLSGSHRGSNPPACDHGRPGGH